MSDHLHGHNCMRHGYQPTSSCPHCLLADQTIREDGFKDGFHAGYGRAIDAAALACYAIGGEADAATVERCREAIRKLKKED